MGAFEDVVEPLVAKLCEVNERDRVPLQSRQRIGGVAQQPDYSKLRLDMVIRTDEEVVFGHGIVLLVLAEVVNAGSWPAVVIPERGEDWDVDPRKLLFVGAHALPVGVVAGMRDPLVEDGIGGTVDLVEVTIGTATHVHSRREGDERIR